MESATVTESAATTPTAAEAKTVGFEEQVQVQVVEEREPLPSPVALKMRKAASMGTYEQALRREELEAEAEGASSADKTRVASIAEEGTSVDSPSSMSVSSVSSVSGEHGLSLRGTSDFSGEATSAPNPETPLDGADLASPSSATSLDSTPSITIIERAVSMLPGVTTERQEYVSTPTSGTSTSSAHQVVDEDEEDSITSPTSRNRAPPTKNGRIAPTLERSHTSSELIGLRTREQQAARAAAAGDKSLYSNPSSGSAPSFEIESVTLPSDGITEAEIEKATHTVFAVEVRLQGGLQWIIRKRYSDFRELHDRLKRTSVPVKQLYFPKRHVFRNRHQSVIEQRRSELEKYINEVLDIRPLIRVPLFNFLEVYAHMESYERKLQRHKKELESERMKNMLHPDHLEDFSAAFKRLCSSKYLYHGSTATHAHGHGHSHGHGHGHTTTTAKTDDSTTSTSPSSSSAVTGSSSAVAVGNVAPPTTARPPPPPVPTSPGKKEVSVSSTASGDSTSANGTTDERGNRHSAIMHTAGSQICISRASFRRDILGVFPDMPSSFAMRFMKAVSDRQGSDINMDEFLRAVAILRCGTMEDQLLFIFNMCDLDHAGKVQSTGLSNFLVSLHGRHVLDRPEYRRLLSEGFDQGRVRMSSEDFVKVVPELKAVNILVDWMEPFVDILCETADPQLLESQEEFNPAVQQKILASETHFNAKEVSILQDAFNNYRASGGGDAVDLDALTSDFPLEMPEDRFCRVFSSFGSRANGSDIDVFSFVNALSIACRGTTEEKAKFAFTMFASAVEGSQMNRDDVYGMLRLDVAQNADFENQITSFMEKKNPPQPPTTTKSTSSSSLIDMGMRTPSVSGSELGIFVDSIMKGFGHQRVVSETDRASKALTLTLEEFTEWASKQEYEMASLRIMREVAFIDLGLVPMNKEEELLIASGCYKPYDPASLVEDEQWFLLERKWFIHWCRYIKIRVKESLSLASSSSVHMTGPSVSIAPTGTSRVPSGGTSASKEAPMKDAEGNFTRPKCINNYPLLTSDRRDRVLRASDEIRAGRHFVIICEQLWMALKLWYGGGPEIGRPVVMTSSGEAKLDIWEVERKKKLAKKTKTKEEGETDEDEEEDVADSSSSSSPSDEERRKQELALPRRMRSGGSVGLSNLGNTCYMNSALQCLTNTQLLAEYFLSGMYLEDINRTSTLGLQGKLAEVYGKLAEDMWCAKQKSISPRNFKKSIGKFNEAFRGNDQQDAQELLAFLLSGLSEDLNRIQDKPYIEQPDSDGRYDADLADEWWRNHLRREVSIIVALFTGQYKSLLTCSVCGFKSARFEPFTFLQVPLPEPTHNTVTVLLVLASGVTPMKVSVRLGISATIFDLKHELMKMCHSEFELPQVSESDIKLCEYSGSMILSFKADNRRVGQIRSIDRLIAFQLEPLDADTIQATRHRRPSYIQPAGSNSASLRAEDMEHPNFYEKLTKGSLVDVRTRTQSHEYAPGVVVECLKTRADYEDQPHVIVRLRRTDDEMKVPVSRLRPRQARLLYIPLLSRKLSYSAVYFKNPFRPVPFGTPNLVRLCPERTTGLQLYQLIYERVKQYVGPDAKPPSTWPEDKVRDTEQLISNHIDGVFAGLKEASVYSDSSCGFLLRRVESKGLTDSRASWLSRSFGFTIPCTDDPLDILEEEAIAIDWDLNVFQDREVMDKMKHVENHSSVARNEAIDKGPVPLSHCLDAFTTEEKINEGYCSSCRHHQEMTKKLEIWRLPPVMVVHLKRFQYTQTYRRKLGSLVEFPIEGLDLSSCVAPHIEIPEKYPEKRPKAKSTAGSAASTASVRKLIKIKSRGSSVADSSSLAGAPPSHETVADGGVDGEDDAGAPDDTPVEANTNEKLNSPEPTADNDSATEAETEAEAKVDVEADDNVTAAEAEGEASAEKTDTTVTVTPSSAPSASESQRTAAAQAVRNRVRRGYTNSNLDESRCMETNYNLYGVVNHQGALGGGHYTAYAKNFVDDQWYYYDDERVRVVEEQQVVSPSAYLLFYLRSDMNGVLVKDLFPQNMTAGKITEEDIERFVEDGDERRCSIM